MNWWAVRFLALLLGGNVVSVQTVNAACVVETSAGPGGGGFVRKLPPDCTAAEREAQTVSGAAILEVLERGQTVELVGVIVRGELNLDRLPAREGGVPEGRGPETQEREEPAELRLVRGELTIRDSTVFGAVRHGSARGVVRFEGLVDLRGTNFAEGVDLSRAVFQKPVELSGSRFQKEAYFVQGVFKGGLSCRDTTFGPHTRFHRSTFHGPVDCTGALFDGLAELLEVRFEESVTFERARFGSGTGFSGSRFMRRASFEDAIFSRDTFFTFSVFEEAAVFAGAQFLGPADFADADFRKPDDLAKARFDSPPQFARTHRVLQGPVAESPDSPIGSFAVTAVCLVLAAALLAYIWKM